MSLEDAIKEYGLFHMYFETRPCQIGTSSFFLKFQLDSAPMVRKKIARTP
jgi:hypothetical protein